MKVWLRKKMSRMGLGKVVYKIWYGPLGRRDQRRRYGGDFQERACRGEEEMRRAVALLPPCPPVAKKPKLPCPIHVLTGINFWHQTAFCLHSLQTALGEGLPDVRIHSDGTLKDENLTALHRVVPSLVVHSEERMRQFLDLHLPVTRFSALRSHRLEFSMMRKFTDSLAGATGLQLVIDSDMLFWSYPDEMVTALAKGESLQLDEGDGETYCLPREKLEKELGVPLRPSVNGGLAAVNASLIDWGFIEKACQIMVGRGNRRVIEQSLWGIALSAQSPHVLSRANYHLCGYPENVATLRARSPSDFPALVHYAWHARYPYLEKEWKLYLQKCGVNKKVEV